MDVVTRRSWLRPLSGAPRAGFRGASRPTGMPVGRAGLRLLPVGPLLPHSDAYKQPLNGRAPQ